MFFDAYLLGRHTTVKQTTKRSSAVAVSLFAGALALSSCSNAANDSALGGSGENADKLATDASGELRAEGSSAQQNAMDNVFSPAFSAATGAQLAYNATGSGAGQTQFISDQVDFAGSDSPLKDDQVEAAAKRCGGNEAWHLPMVIGPVAVAYKLDGVEETLNLSTMTIAKIFKGEITSWDDPAIQGENPGVNLPAVPISVVYRADESGTSDNFQKFLRASTDGYWTDEGKSFPTAVGAGTNKSTGVAHQVAVTNGAITYVESGYAKEREGDMNIAKIDFGKGPVELNSTSVNKALDTVVFSGEGHNLVVDSDALYASKEDGAYPLVLTTYEIVCSAGYDENTAKLVKNFLYTMLDNQSEDLENEGYIPVDGQFKDKLTAAVDAL
ncbi:phosphate ABC transporter substrate-binding protein PstS [Corynebacterium sp. 320]|nr:phosphate ABC transporter substrate-binding protein PstS [Corynebacterium sp. 320]KAB1550794.1 phosphate ABC transporter substrate-binding protein PstS [Corynebacterium sp. 321]KAB1551151.1 phosphate ABC transporter substrate-binding protein PstS [Corynebacterium sp. 319]KAB3526792.1 phosphate ABC transporter substrate-binding protein PstS [Corynebacterium sp. 250]KAB3538287.1 phosphate ABC transporter substrate-binding protein PstS [Corynebacterium sp. 366]QNP92592.1 phosphate ABC transpor